MASGAGGVVCTASVDLQANGLALDEPALAGVAGVGGALERAQVLLVRGRGEVIHHAAKTKNKMRKPFK